MRGLNENEIVASPESVFVHLNVLERDTYDFPFHF